MKAIKADSALMETDASRFANGWDVNPSTFHPDSEKHILAFDIIYCCSTYNLFKGITYVRPKTKERQLIQEKKDKAQWLLKKLQQAQEQQEKLEEALQVLHEVLNVGTKVKHPIYGCGTITAKSEKAITINFANENERRFGLVEGVAGSFISAENEETAARLTAIKEVLKKKSGIENAVLYAERAFAPYSDYI